MSRNGRAYGIALLLTVSLLATSTLNAEDDLKKLEGTWTLFHFEEDGRAVSARARLLISGKHFVIVWDGDRGTGTHKLYPTATPGAIDVMWSDGDIARGIYRIQGDIYTACYGPNRRVRPRSFSSRNGGSLVYWKRQGD